MRSEKHSQFAAHDAILGFKYQIRYALLEFLKARAQFGPDIGIAVERIDDIDVEVAGRVTTLIQTKNTATVLSNSSQPFWKTIRVWCDAITSGKVRDIKAVEFILVSTSDTGEESITSKLIDSASNKDRTAALEQMQITARDKRNAKALGRAFKSFDDLLPQQQFDLISRIRVRPNALTFDELDQEIRKQNQHGPPGKEVAFAKVLFGRWEMLIEKYLRSKDESVIPWIILQSLLHETAGQFQNDNLPITFDGMVQGAFPDLGSDERCFIRQLESIGATEKQRRRAQISQLRATQLKSFWQRHLLVRPDEILGHEKILIAECEVQHEASDENDESSELDPEEIGMQIYDWAMLQAPFLEEMRIRSKCVDADVIRGTFHDLADRPSLGWHPLWETMFAHSNAEV